MNDRSTQVNTPSRRAVAKGAAWAGPVLTLPALAPSVAASNNLAQDIQLSRSGLATQRIYEFRNYGPGSTTASVTYKLQIVQTAGGTNADRPYFRPSDLNILDRYVLGDPQYSTGNPRTTTQTFTILAGLSAVTAFRLIDLRVDFPVTSTFGAARNRNARWTVSILADFQDVNDDNSSGIYEESGGSVV